MLPLLRSVLKLKLTQTHDLLSVTRHMLFVVTNPWGSRSFVGSPGTDSACSEPNGPQSSIKTRRHTRSISNPPALDGRHLLVRRACGKVGWGGLLLLILLGLVFLFCFSVPISHLYSFNVFGGDRKGENTKQT